MYKSVLFLVVFFTSCTSFKKEKAIDLPNKISILLNKKEKQIREQSSFLIDDFFSFFNEDSKKTIPLYRTITHGNYSLFIGLPYNKTVASISTDNLMNNNYSLIESKIDKNYSHKIYKNKEGGYLVEFTKELDRNLIYILGTTNKLNIVETVLNLQELTNRIITP